MANMFKNAILCTAFILSVHTLRTDSVPLRPVVHTALGDIRGVVTSWKNGIQYQAFRGVPYARPPVGDLRFAKPQPHPGYGPGVLDAAELGKACLQGAPGPVGFNDTLMSEDCLFLNVFVPMKSSAQPADDTPRQTTGSDPYPVLVFIHGGGFVQGSSDGYDPGKLVTEGDIIVVTINYRLTIFGFLSTNDSALPGNYGLWDQHLALKWVKDNIRSFGGDPDKITISGESAGAASVSYQTLASVSKGVFTRAILQSGTATSSWALQRNPKEFATTIAARLGCQTNIMVGGLPVGVVGASSQEILACLRRHSPADIAKAGDMSGSMSLARRAIDFVYVPTVDGDFVPKDPQDMLKDRQYLDRIGFYDRDYLSGVVNQEGGILYLTIGVMLQENVTAVLTPGLYDGDLVKVALRQRFGDTAPILEKMVAFFYTYPRYQGEPLLNAQGVLDTEGDPGFYVPLVDFARAVAEGRHNDKRNLVYFFNHYPQYMSGDVQGINHAGDLLYEFDFGTDSEWLSGGNGSLWNSDDEWMGQAYRSVIVDFVKSGDPAHSLAPSLPNGWPDFDLVNESYLSLSPNNLTVGQHLHGRRVALWLDLLPQLRSQLIKN